MKTFLSLMFLSLFASTAFAEDPIDWERITPNLIDCTGFISDEDCAERPTIGPKTIQFHTPDCGRGICSFTAVYYEKFCHHIGQSGDPCNGKFDYYPILNAVFYENEDCKNCADSIINREFYDALIKQNMSRQGFKDSVWCYGQFGGMTTHLFTNTACKNTNGLVCDWICCVNTTHIGINNGLYTDYYALGAPLMPCLGTECNPQCSDVYMADLETALCFMDCNFGPMLVDSLVNITLLPGCPACKATIYFRKSESICDGEQYNDVRIDSIRRTPQCLSCPGLTEEVTLIKALNNLVAYGAFSENLPNDTCIYRNRVIKSSCWNWGYLDQTILEPCFAFDGCCWATLKICRNSHGAVSWIIYEGSGEGDSCRVPHHPCYNYCWDVPEHPFVLPGMNESEKQDIKLMRDKEKISFEFGGDCGYLKAVISDPYGRVYYEALMSCVNGFSYIDISGLNLPEGNYIVALWQYGNPVKSFKINTRGK